MTLYVREMAQGSRIDTPLLVRSKELRVARNGDAYLSLELADRTGVMPAVMFRPGPESIEVPVGAVARAVGTVSTYRGSKRLLLDLFAPAGTWDPGAFVAVGSRDQAELLAEFRRLGSAVAHAGLRRLLRRVFAAPEFFERFCVSPASQHGHCAYIGGLLEHTVNVAALCASVALRYDGVDDDLLVTAALLHDIGVVDELSVGTGISKTDEGRLIGHVAMGYKRVADAAKAVRLERRIAAPLQHAILSHHEEALRGSLEPSTLEALVLRHADTLDMQAAGMSAVLPGAVRAGESWTDGSNFLRRPLYVSASESGGSPSQPAQPSRDDGEPVRLSA